MNKAKLFIGLAALGLVLSSCTINRQNQQEEVRKITVSGTGKVNVAPDQLSLSFSIKTIDWNVNTASTANAATTEKVITAISDAGVSKKDIQTSDYRISQETYMSGGRETPGRYTVTNTLNVLIRNTSIAGNVIDAAIRNGSNGLSNFEYSASDTTTAVREARTLAIQDAFDAANLLAGASGCKVDKVLNIQEGYTSIYSNTSVAAFEMADSASTPIRDSTIAVSTHVTITYSLID